MDNTTSMQAQPKLSFLHHIRLVPLFSSILGGIILLFALSSQVWQAISCSRPITINRMSRQKSGAHRSVKQFQPFTRTARINMIHAGAASRIAEMEAMKQNIAEAEIRIRQSQDGLPPI